MERSSGHGHENSRPFPDDGTSTTSAQLSALLDADPSLAPRVAAHPSADDTLLRRLVALEDPVVDAALAWRRPPAEGWGRTLRLPVTDQVAPLARAEAVAAVPTWLPDDAPLPGRRPWRSRWLVGVGSLVVVLALVAVALQPWHKNAAASVYASFPTVAPYPSFQPAARSIRIPPSPTPASAGGALAHQVRPTAVETGDEPVLDLYTASKRYGLVAVTDPDTNAPRNRQTWTGVDLVTGTVLWTASVRRLETCLHDGGERRCRFAELPPTCRMGHGNTAWCQSLNNGGTQVRPLDVATGQFGDPVPGALGMGAGGVVTAQVGHRDQIGSGARPKGGPGAAVMISLTRGGHKQWSTPLPSSVPLPSSAHTSGGIVDDLALVPLPETLGVVAVNVAARPPCAPFPGDDGRCMDALAGDPGRTVLFDARTGAVLGNLNGLAELPVGDQWYVNTGTILALQHADGTAAADPRSIPAQATVEAVTDDAVLVTNLPGNAKPTLTALDRQDGHPRWSVVGTPLATDGDRVIVATDYGVLAVGLRSGEPAWQAPADAKIAVWGPHLVEETPGGVRLLTSSRP